VRIFVTTTGPAPSSPSRRRRKAFDPFRQFGPAVTEPAGNRTVRTPPRSHRLERTRLHAPPEPPPLLFSRRKPRDRTLLRTCEIHHQKQARDCRGSSQRHDG